jgi:hypothetical protein
MDGDGQVRMTRGRTTAVFLIGVVAWTFACESDATRPAGEETRGAQLQATVVSPHGSEGAAVIEVEGLRVVGVTTDDGQVFVSRSGDILRAVIVRDEPGPLQFTVQVLDPRFPVATRILQVADGDNRVRPTVDGYQVELTW